MLIDSETKTEIFNNFIWLFGRKQWSHI